MLSALFTLENMILKIETKLCLILEEKKLIPRRQSFLEIQTFVY
jgi:hypothetical protein